MVGVVNGIFCSTSFLVFMYHYTCFCLYTKKNLFSQTQWTNTHILLQYCFTGHMSNVIITTLFLHISVMNEKNLYI